MAYKTILTVLSHPSQVPQLDDAAALAAAHDAHLDILCLGIDHSQAGYFFPGGTSYGWQEAIDSALTDANALDRKVRDRMAASHDLRWSCEAAVTQSLGIASLWACGRGSRTWRSWQPLCQGPARRRRTDHRGRAVRGGLPRPGPAAGLRAGCRAPPHPGRVEPVRRGPGRHPPRPAPAARRRDGRGDLHRSAQQRAGTLRSGGALTQMLTRHGVHAQIAVLARTAPRISDEINRRAIEVDADMVVMGAYGHSRLREAILGGATRNMLEQARVPVFLAR